MRAVVVTPTLDWRLHGFDLLSEHTAAGDPESGNWALTAASWMVASQYKPAEVGRSDWQVMFGFVHAEAIRLRPKYFRCWLDRKQSSSLMLSRRAAGGEGGPTLGGGRLGRRLSHAGGLQWQAVDADRGSPQYRADPQSHPAGM